MVQKEWRLLSCIETARDCLKKDPHGQVIWSGEHAYFIPSGAKKNAPAQNVKIQFQIGPTRFHADNEGVDKKTVRQLLAELRGGSAKDITKLLKKKTPIRSIHKK